MSKDRIDLSAIQANLTVSGKHFTYIGSAPFTSAGAQVRVVQEPSSNLTLVEATLAGDSSPDLEIRLAGILNLTAANFVLTGGWMEPPIGGSTGSFTAQSLISTSLTSNHS